MKSNITFFETNTSLWIKSTDTLQESSTKAHLFYRSNQLSQWKSKEFVFSSNWLIRKNVYYNIIMTFQRMKGSNKNLSTLKTSWLKEFSSQIGNATIKLLQIYHFKKIFYGFRLTRGGQYLELYASSQDGANFYFDYIKNYVIQTQFYDKYQLGNKIGQGNFAKVFIARQIETKKDYAVKVFCKQNFKNMAVDKPALIKEISILRKLNHQGVIKLYEVYESENNIYLVKELLKGGELLHRLKKATSYSEKYVAQVMLRLFSALEYIHSKGILHRDIKPENLILHSRDNSHDICLADFGLADYYNPQGNYIFKRCGTPGYVAPELLQDKIYDTKIDIFSAGTLMFLMLAGRQAFHGATYDDVVIKNYNCDINYADLQQKLTPEAFSLLKQLLNKNPKIRPSAGEAIQNEWFIKVLESDEINSTLHLYCEIKKITTDENLFLYSKSPMMMSKSPLASPMQSPDWFSKSPYSSAKTTDLSPTQSPNQQVKNLLINRN